MLQPLEHFKLNGKCMTKSAVNNERRRLKYGLLSQMSDQTNTDRLQMGLYVGTAKSESSTLLEPKIEPHWDLRQIAWDPIRLVRRGHHLSLNPCDAKIFLRAMTFSKLLCPSFRLSGCRISRRADI